MSAAASPRLPCRLCSLLLLLAACLPCLSSPPSLHPFLRLPTPRCSPAMAAKREGLGGSSSPPLPNRTPRCSLLMAMRKDGLGDLLRESCAAGGMVLVDVENVRGKGGFHLSHHSLLTSLGAWAREHGLAGRVVAVVDHGRREEGAYVHSLGLAAVFAGSQQKADDVIVAAVEYFSRVEREA